MSASPTPSTRAGRRGSDRVVELDARGRRLRAALAAVLVRADAPELRLAHQWLDSGSGVGLLATGLERQGWDLQLTEYGDGHWRATFYSFPWQSHRVRAIIASPTTRICGFSGRLVGAEGSTQWVTQNRVRFGFHDFRPIRDCHVSLHRHRGQHRPVGAMAGRDEGCAGTTPCATERGRLGTSWLRLPDSRRCLLHCVRCRARCARHGAHGTTGAARGDVGRDRPAPRADGAPYRLGATRRWPICFKPHVQPHFAFAVECPRWADTGHARDGRAATRPPATECRFAGPR